jgi:hypothetical protein
MHPEGGMSEVVAEQLARAREPALKDRIPKRVRGPEAISGPDSRDVARFVAQRPYALSDQSTP